MRYIEMMHAAETAISSVKNVIIIDLIGGYLMTQFGEKFVALNKAVGDCGSAFRSDLCRGNADKLNAERKVAMQETLATTAGPVELPCCESVQWVRPVRAPWTKSRGIRELYEIAGQRRGVGQPSGTHC